MRKNEFDDRDENVEITFDDECKDMENANNPPEEPSQQKKLMEKKKDHENSKRTWMTKNEYMEIQK